MRAEKVLTENFETKHNDSGYTNENNLDWKRNQNLQYIVFSNTFKQLHQKPPETAS